MRALCKKEAYVADKLFATLGTEVGKFYIDPPLPADGEHYVYQAGREVLVIDTIGFIRDLPPQLIKAFASTLEDSIQSDVLLHVIDATDPDRQRKIEIVEEILKQIKAIQPMIYVFNKIDQLDNDTKKIISDQYSHLPHVFVSALSGEGLEELKQKMVGMVN
jgi:GTP-binding protein HflX